MVKVQRRSLFESELDLNNEYCSCSCFASEIQKMQHGIVECSTDSTRTVLNDTF